MKSIHAFSKEIIKSYKSYDIDDVEVLESENFTLSTKSRHQNL